MNLYIGNLSYQVKEADLAQLMEQFGEVSSVRLITDRETRRSKGFGFVEFVNEGDAKAAIEELNGKEFSNRPMVVKVALPKESR